LYGMANNGGSNSTNSGVIFSMNTNGSNYQNLHNFSVPDGSNPYGSLIRSGNMLYGMTCHGGQFGNGVIFSINTNGSGFTDLWDFSFNPTDSINPATGGGNPNGTLFISGNILYGTTYGPANSDGNVFSIHTDGSNYTDLLEFNGTNGSHPGYGALTLSGNTLFGTTMYGGANGDGLVFSIDTLGANYHDLLDFNYANGEMPYGALVVSGNVLYGNTSSGGSYGMGTIFSIHTDGSAFNNLFSFTGTNGSSPEASLMLSGNILFGTTSGGGANAQGTLFAIDTLGFGFQTLFNFVTPTGTQPRATLSKSGTKLYGTTVTGGIYADGTVFSFPLTYNVIGINENNYPAILNVYPNPSTGIFTLNSKITSGEISVRNTVGEIVLLSTINQQSSAIDLSNQPNGIYFVNVKTEKESFTQKMIISK
jgi:uncharacterized repeat protein (TIGR03803 family)